MRQFVRLCVLYLGLSASALSAQDFARVEPGQFEMGINMDEKFSFSVYKEYTPQHRVSITYPFEIAKTPTTFEEFFKVLDWAVSKGKLWKMGNTYSASFFGRQILALDDWIVLDGADDGRMGENKKIGDLTPEERRVLPVVRVSWYAAALYCNWKSEMDGLTPTYNELTWTCDFTKNGYRLPTEAEYVWAYRGGQQSRGYTYAGSNSADEVGWHDHNSYGLVPVGQKKPNELGLFDMCGDIYEWTNDWFEYFKSDDAVDPRGAESSGGKTDSGFTGKILLGGGWNGDKNGMRAELREPMIPESVDFAGGFRLVKKVVATPGT